MAGRGRRAGDGLQMSRAAGAGGKGAAGARLAVGRRLLVERGRLLTR